MILHTGVLARLPPPSCIITAEVYALILCKCAIASAVTSALMPTCAVCLRPAADSKWFNPWGFKLDARVPYVWYAAL